MKNLRLREFVGLGALAIALVFGFIFINPSSGESSSATTAGVHLGLPVVPTPTAPAQPTPTPAPGRVTQTGAGWFLQYVELDAQGSEFPNGGGVAQTLDLSFPGAPFPDFKDNHWLVRAEGTLRVSTPGLQQFMLQVQGDVTVSVGGKVVAHALPGAGPQLLAVRFEHAPGTVQVKIEARDISGPFKLHWAG